MKCALLTAMVLAAASPALAQGGSGSTGAMPGAMTDGAMVSADGAGVVKALDAGAGTVTIQHGPIAALKWPAMTMTFKAQPPSVLRDVHVGEKVAFRLMQMGGSTTLTSIRAK
ncbi:MAG TPA: copper-binding protein [Caulobacteraceae bacterium]|nr:copper-binding protein [Caulobacteraceae bacterium]